MNAKAANSAALNGHPDSYFLTTTGRAASAATADAFSGVSSSSFLRADLGSQSTKMPLTVAGSGTTTLILGSNTGNGGIYGANSAGNFHLDSQSASDGRIYFNWFSGKGVAFGNAQGSQGTGAVVASVDLSGNMHAASFNGLKIFAQSAILSISSCDAVCVGASGTCISAKRNGSHVACSYSIILPGTMDCRCSSF